MLERGIAFIKRDFLIDTSYRVNFLLNILNTFFRVSFFYFFSLFIGVENYFPFVLVGIALFDYFSVLTRSFSETLREAQQEGTLEALASTLTPLFICIVFSGLYPLLYTVFQILLYFIIGASFYHLSLAGANYPAALLVMLTATFSFAGFGLLSSIFVLVYKRGDPLIWVLNSLSWLLSGTLYPVAVLPGWLQQATKLLPLTHALQALRLTLLEGAPLSKAAVPLAFLAALFFITSSLFIFLFPRALKKVKNAAGLSQY
ncbi:MAG: ABC transporter permease [Peptococcaceae bacterium]|nr:ABC transporter permease [Peptococcaceae bacterium]MDH7523955.1 ABC transporter permease [Peptococcaceae bacterium]